MGDERPAVSVAGAAEPGRRHPPRGGRWVVATVLRPGQADAWVAHAGWWYRATVLQVGGATGRAKFTRVRIVIRDGRERVLKVVAAVLEPERAAE